MGKIYVKNGTPAGEQSKCASCEHVHMVRGFRESEEIVLCTYHAGPPLNVPFKVYECSNYLDRGRPSWQQMEDLAIDILPTPCLKPAGFRIGFKEDKEEEEDLEAATAKH